MAGGVLSGAEPLNRSQTSGGISGGDFYTQRFGAKTRISALGWRRPLPIEQVLDTYFSSVSNPLKMLSMNFNDFFKFIKDNRKIDMKEKKGGLFKTLHSLAPHFFDFKVWKKITGTARKPEVAALHQIRNILIKVHKLNKDEYGRDPRDIITSAFNILPMLRKKFAGEGEEKAGIFKTVKAVFMESYKERKQEDINFWKSQGLITGKEAKERTKEAESINTIKEVILGKKPIKVTDANSKATSKNTQDTEDILKKQAEDSKFAEYQNQATNKKLTKVGFITKWLKRLLPFAALAGVLALTFGKKGLIAGAAAAFFLRILPSLLKAGLKGIFNFGKSSLSKLAKSVGSKGIGATAKNIGMKVGSAGARTGAAGAGIGLTLHDFLKEGGGLEQIKQGGAKGIGGGVLTTLFGGGGMKEAGGMKVAGNIAKQTLKGAAFGTAIAPGIGTAIGAAVSFVGSSLKVMWEKGILQFFGKVIKKNWLGAAIGGALGSIIPGPGTIIGVLGGAFAQDKLRDPKIREKIKKTFMSVASKIGNALRSLGGKMKKFGSNIFTKLKNRIRSNKIGAIAGGLLGSLLGPAGTIIGVIGGTFAQEKFMQSKFFDGAKDMFSKVSSTIKDIFASRSFSEALGKVKNLKKPMMKFAADFGSSVKGWMTGYWADLKTDTKWLLGKGKSLVTGQVSSGAASSMDKQEKDLSKQKGDILDQEEKNAKLTAANLAAEAALKLQIGMLNGITELGKIFKNKKLSVWQVTGDKKNTKELDEPA